MYVVLHEVTCHGVWLYGMHRMCWDSSSFTWHQPCNNKTVLLVHHFSGGEEGAVAAWRDSDSQPHAKESSAFTTSPHRLKLWGPQDTHTHTHTNPTLCKIIWRPPQGGRSWWCSVRQSPGHCWQRRSWIWTSPPPPRQGPQWWAAQSTSGTECAPPHAECLSEVTCTQHRHLHQAWNNKGS